MKKYLSILAVSAMAVSAFAQGTIVFNNGPSSVVQRWTSATDQTLMAVPRNTGMIQLVYAPQGTAGDIQGIGGGLAAWVGANPGWAIASTAVGTFNAPGSGRYSLGQHALTGITAGNSIDYVVVGWSDQTQTSFDAALAANDLVGWSTKFTSSTGGAGTPPSPGTPLADSMTSGFTLSPIPEPSAFALAGLGAAALLIFRRRN